MEYELKKVARAAKLGRGGKGARLLPLSNLEVSREEGDEIVGPAILLKGEELKDVSTKVYAQAAKQKVKVTLRSSEEGVLVFRIQRTFVLDGEEIPQNEIVRRAKREGFTGAKEPLIVQRLEAGVTTWRDLLKDPTKEEWHARVEKAGLLKKK